MKEGVLTNLMEAAWIEGQAAEMDISVSDSAVAKETEKLFKEKFPKEGERLRYLVESNLTHEDLEHQVKVHILSSKIQEQLEGDPSVPSKDEVEEYYDAAKDSEYTQEEKREARALTFKDKSQAEEAKAELEKDDSLGNWKRVGAKSDNAVAKKTGGLVNDSAEGEGTAPEPLHAALFAAPQGQVEGPLGIEDGYEVYEVMKITPEKVIGLGEVEAQIKSQLEETAQQNKLTTFVEDFYGRWTSHTFCAEGYVVEKCANFKGTGHSPEASPACYEANPKTPAEVCPAPVTQVKPAEPGSITPLMQEGTKLPQAPHPAGALSPPSYPIEAPAAPPSE
jgi:parvulin-like peptidyl-prolyl isomerase